MEKLNFIIPLVVYPFSVMVSFGESDEEIGRRLKKYGVSAKDIEAAYFKGKLVHGRTVVFEGNQTLIRLRFIPKEAKDFGHLQHEVFHAVSFIMWKIGMPLKILKSDEAYAYLIDYITVKIYDKLKI